MNNVDARQRADVCPGRLTPRWSGRARYGELSRVVRHRPGRRQLRRYASAPALGSTWRKVGASRRCVWKKVHPGVIGMLCVLQAVVTANAKQVSLDVHRTLPLCRFGRRRLPSGGLRVIRAAKVKPCIRQGVETGHRRLTSPDSVEMVESDADYNRRDMGLNSTH